MIQQSGRSLIEVIGVMAITGVMTVGAIGAYRMIRANQVRAIAAQELKQIAENTKILLEMRGSYEGVSVDYLIKAGALKTDVAPIGGDAWSVSSGIDGSYFSINLVDLTNGECEYFLTNRPNWANKIMVNGLETASAGNCFSSDTNQISFIVQ
ncbi:MAG: hypothetical protein J6R99_03055 [Alphaproteobacteria bacterium]|nr:hypothetical protein [Alphaproteobacteria bacterium]